MHDNTSNTKNGVMGQNSSLNESKTNEKFKDKSNKQLISEFESNLAELNKMAKIMDEKFVANYSDNELKKLKSEIEQLNISEETKDSLLDKLNAAQEKNNQVLQFLSEGNVKQATNMLKAESNIMNALINELNAQNGKEIATNDAEKLIQHANNIKKGIDEGSVWILQENPDMKITPTPEQLTQIESKTTEIREIVTELQTRGVPVEVKTVDISELESKSSSDKTKKNNHAEVHAIAPILVIVILGVEYALLPMVAACFAYDGKIKTIEKKTGKHVCMSCRTQIFEYEIGFALATSLAGGWILQNINYIKYTITLNEKYTIDLAIGELIDFYIDQFIGTSCNTYLPECPFYKGKSDPAIAKFDAPAKVRLHQVCPVNVTVVNKGKSYVNTCAVALFVNSTPADTPEQKQYANYTLVGNVSTGVIDVNGTETVNFNWFAENKGNNVLKAVTYSVNDADKINNVAYTNVEVLNSALVRCTLYNTTVYPSSSDPTKPRGITYYYKAERPVLLDWRQGTPTFIYETSNPEYSPIGFQSWYPYGAIWQLYSNSPEPETFIPCFYNPYAVCQPNQTEYQVDHWAMGSGYCQYFAVTLRTQSSFFWTGGILKTQLNELWLYDKAA